MDLDWNLVLIMTPIIIATVGLMILLIQLGKSTTGPTERERILQNTLDTLLKVHAAEMEQLKTSSTNKESSNGVN